jgi:tRNA(adenine34) deaminase
MDASHSQVVHEQHMRRAIELAANGGRFPFGAVIVDRDTQQIAAEGWNRSSLNPIWHGEIDALNHLAESRTKFDAARLVLYSTAEPCPMCQSAILWTGVGLVVYGTSIRFLQSHGWPQIDITAEEVVRRNSFRQCALVGGVLEQECNALFLAAPPNAMDF